MVCDPIVLIMHFDVITSNKAEAAINKVASAVFSYAVPYIKRWIEEYSTPSGMFFSGCDGLAEPENYGVELSKHQWSDAEIDQWIERIIDRTGRSSVLNWSLADIRLRNSMKKHSSKPNALYKKYKSCFSGKNDFDKKQMVNLLNCPNDSLSEVQYPISFLNSSFFEILKYCYPVSDYHVIGLDNPLDKEQFLHRIDVSIPRILLCTSEEIRAFQDIMIRLLLTLGEAYPHCRGSIRLDVPTQYSSPYLNVIDHYYMQKSTIYYGKILPGYSWGMLWNKDLSSLIPLAQEDEKAFSKVLRLKNGNLWLQCSDWVDLLSREQNTIAVKTLEKYTSIPKIPLPTYTFPNSIRFAIDENDLAILDYDDHSAIT